MLNHTTVLAPPPHPKTTFPSLPMVNSSSVNQVHIWSVVGGKGQCVIMYEAITMVYLTLPWPGHELIHLCARNHASKSLHFPCQAVGCLVAELLKCWTAGPGSSPTRQQVVFFSPGSVLSSTLK